eukprot:m51a1_g6022 hypothetical protein (1656) ;mRNA; f:85651-94698
MRALGLMVALLAAQALCCDDHCQWSAWKAKHGKSYGSAEEDRHRFDVFRTNVAEYARRNAEPGQTATYAPDKFSDMTGEEFSAAYLMPDGIAAHRMTPPREAPDAPMKRADFPTSFLSPYTLTARQQGTCGSCWAFTSAAVMEGANMRATGTQQWVSPQNLLDCADYNSGHFGRNYDGCRGYRTDAMLSEVVDKGTNGGGVMFESNYPYRGVMQSCKHSLAYKGDLKLSSYFTERFNEYFGSNLYSRLMQYGPLAVALNYGNLDGYAGGIIRHSSNCIYTKTGYNGIDHAVTLVGWGIQNGVNYWVMKNSWGPDWGEPKDISKGGPAQGYFRIQRGVGACHLTDDAAVGVVVARTQSGTDSTPADSTPAPCSPVSRSKACGSRTCGSVDNGCGAPIACGYCNSGQACSTSGACNNVDDASDWAQVMPADVQDFAVSMSNDGVTIETKTDTDTEKRIAWKTSGEWINDRWTSFSVNVKADAAGVVGIGMRMGQPGGDLNGISWKLRLSAPSDGGTTASAQLQRCFLYGTNDNCGALADLSVEMKAFHNFTINFAQQRGNITMRPFLDGRPLMGNRYYWIERSNFPNVGKAFLVASGAGKHFQSPRLRTRSTVQVSMASCHTTDAWSSEVARILSVPGDFIVDVTGGRGAGSQCGDGQFDSFNVTLLDSNATVGIVAQASLPAANGLTQATFSNALAEQLVQTVAGGGLENMGIAGATAEVVTPALAEIPDGAVAVAVAEGVALSTGAIVGIAVGGGVALAAVAAGVGAGLYAATRPEPAEPMPDSYQPRNPLRKTFYKVSVSRGVDVMSGKQHQSITGRAPPHRGGASAWTMSDDDVVLRTVSAPRRIPRSEALALWASGRATGLFNLQTRALFDACADLCVESAAPAPACPCGHEALAASLRRQLDAALARASADRAAAALALARPKGRRPQCQWSNYKTQHFAAFEEALRDIAAKNAIEGGAHYALNEFSDVPRTEFAARFLGYTPAKNPPRGSAPPRIMRRGPLPKTFRSPYATPARNQRDCGGCWSFATMGVVEAAWLKAHGNSSATRAPEVFAPEQLLDCNTQNNACGGGDYFVAADWLQQETVNGGGVVRESTMPFVNREGTGAGHGRRQCTYQRPDGVGKITLWYRVPLDESDDSAVMHLLHENGPLALSIHGDGLNNYHSGVISQRACAGLSGTTHAVLLIGWGVDETSGTPYWLVKNSWGPDWPQSNPAADGTFKIVRGANACNIATVEVMGVVVEGDALVGPAASGCGTRQCGVVDLYDAQNPAPRFVVCGGCAAGTTCTADGACEPMWDASKWVPTNGATAADWSVAVGPAGVQVDLVGAPKSEKYIAWLGSARWATQWTTVNAMVTVSSADSVVGLGMTSKSGSSEGAVFRFVLGGSGANVYACTLQGKMRTCQSVGTAAIKLNTPTKIAARFVHADSTIGASVYVNDQAVISGDGYVALAATETFLSDVGDVLLLASGQVSFAAPGQLSRKLFTVSSSPPIQDWTSVLAGMMLMPQDELDTKNQEYSTWQTFFEDSQYNFLKSPVVTGQDGNVGVLIGAFGGGYVSRHMTASAMLAQLKALSAGRGVDHMGFSTHITWTFEDQSPVLSGSAVAWAPSEAPQPIDISPERPTDQSKADTKGAACATAAASALAVVLAAARSSLL